jgi:hypothetical protein
MDRFFDRIGIEKMQETAFKGTIADKFLDSPAVKK